MSSEGIPLQADLFTGELVDTRSAKQRQADVERTSYTPLMFSQRDIVPEVGMRARPKLPIPANVTRPALWTDARTEEEIERDMQREAEKLTAPLFAPTDAELRPSTAAVEIVQAVPQLLMDEPPLTPSFEPLPEEDEPDEVLVVFTETTPAERRSVYLALVQASEEHTSTLWIDPHYQAQHNAQVDMVVAEAQQAGLSDTEIKMAITIGNHRATRHKRKAEGKAMAYLHVVSAVEEHTRLVRADPHTPRTTQVNEAYQVATQAGLNADELTLACIIGAYRSKPPKSSTPKIRRSLPLSERIEKAGYRVRARQSLLGLRQRDDLRWLY
jgi:hypothetical protein